MVRTRRNRGKSRRQIANKSHHDDYGTSCTYDLGDDARSHRSLLVPVSKDGGQDPPRSSQEYEPCIQSTHYSDITKHDIEPVTNGIHPSRLVLFEAHDSAIQIKTPLTMAPGPDQRGQHSQQSSQHPYNQQRPTPNGLNTNGEHQRQNPQSQPSHHRDQDRDQRQRQSNGAPPTPTGNGPIPSHIQVAKPYVFQQAIEGCLKDVGVAQAREDSIRLAGVQWIDNVRRALKLPVRTFDTAVIYYHKFRLVHSDGEYNFLDAAAASLFAACKIEDTLKKSRDILCAAHNMKITNRAEHLSPDDSSFEHHSRSIIGLERLMLESSSFDFRNRHPQQLLVKIAKFYNLPKSSAILKTAYTICLDLYRTFAPLKQCTATLAFACLELAGRLLGETENYPGLEDIVNGRDYDRWNISRSEVMETLLDLLELYTHYRTSTVIGPDFNLDAFLEVRISLNEELNTKSLPRFTEYIPPQHLDRQADVGSYAATLNGVSAAATAANGSAAAAGGRIDQSPISPSVGPGTTRNGVRQKAGERGREGTVRFILNPDRERQERAVVAEYGVPAPSAGIGGALVPSSNDSRARR